MNIKFNYKPYIAILFISGLMIVSGYRQVVSAQDVTPTPSNFVKIQGTSGNFAEGDIFLNNDDVLVLYRDVTNNKWFIKTGYET